MCRIIGRNDSRGGPDVSPLLDSCETVGINLFLGSFFFFFFLPLLLFLYTLASTFSSWRVQPFPPNLTCASSPRLPISSSCVCARLPLYTYLFLMSCCMAAGRSQDLCFSPLATQHRFKYYLCSLSIFFFTSLRLYYSALTRPTLFKLWPSLAPPTLYRAHVMFSFIYYSFSIFLFFFLAKRKKWNIYIKKKITSKPQFRSNSFFTARFEGNEVILYQLNHPPLFFLHTTDDNDPLPFHFTRSFSFSALFSCVNFLNVLSNRTLFIFCGSFFYLGLLLAVVARWFRFPTAFLITLKANI